jgi:hypothetical protein
MSEITVRVSRESAADDSAKAGLPKGKKPQFDSAGDVRGQAASANSIMVICWFCFAVNELPADLTQYSSFCCWNCGGCSDY